jgi:hypothetical protein
MALMLRATMSVALLCVILAGSSHAAPGLPQELKDGIEAYNQVEYGAALMYLKAALQRAKGPRALAMTYFYLGCTHFVLEEHGKARVAFETLLSFDPAYVPNRRLTSPKIAAFFERVRQSYATPDGPPSLAHQVPARATSSLTVLTLEALNVAPRLRPVLYYRSSSSPGYFVVEATRRGSRVSFAAPTPPDGGDLLYYFALVDRGGVVTQQLGSAARPFRLRPKPRGSSAAVWYRSWWFWTTVGLVAATSVGVGLGLGLRSEPSASAQITLLRRDGNGNLVPLFQ